MNISVNFLGKEHLREQIQEQIELSKRAEVEIDECDTLLRQSKSSGLPVSIKLEIIKGISINLAGILKQMKKGTRILCKIDKLYIY